MTQAKLIEAIAEALRDEFDTVTCGKYESTARSILAVIFTHCTLCSKEPVAWIAKEVFPDTQMLEDENCTPLYAPLEDE